MKIPENREKKICRTENENSTAVLSEGGGILGHGTGRNVLQRLVEMPIFRNRNCPALLFVFENSRTFCSIGQTMEKDTF